MYQILIDGVLLYDAVDDSQSVSEASITQEINAAAYLDLTVSGTSPVAISEGSSVAEVLWEGKTLFHGLVTDVTEDTYGQLKVSAVSDIDRLNDVLVRPNSTDGSVGEQSPSTLGAYFQWLVTQYNAGNVGGFRIDVGVNQGDQLRTTPISVETTNYPSVASCIDGSVLSNGGYLYYTPFSGGGTLDLYADLHEASDQLIEVGENVVSIEVTRTDDSVVTALVPYATVDGEELTISGASAAELQMLSNAGFSVNGDAFYSDEQVAKYGYREARVEFDGATSVTELVQLAVPYLRTVMSPSVTVSVKAVDMALYKEGYDHLRVGQAVHVRSALHGIDGYMAVQDMDLDLEDPSQTSYTLGVSYDTLTGQQSAFLSKLNGSINGALDKVTGLEDTINKVVNDSNVEYYVSTSPDEPTGGEWGVAVVTPTDNKYVFSHTKNELVDGTIVTSDPTLVTPSITRSLQLHRDFGTDGYTWVNFIAANYDVTDDAAGVCRIVGQMGGWDANSQGAVTVAFGFQDSAYSTGSGSLAGVGVVSEKSSDIDLDATDILSFVDNGRVSVFVRCKGQVTVNLYAEGDGFSTPFIEQDTQPGGTQVFDLADTETTYDSAILQADNAIRAYVAATYATQDALGEVQSSFDLRANQIEASVEEKMDTSVANSTFVDKSTYNQFSDSITQSVESVRTVATDAQTAADGAQQTADAASTAASAAQSAANSASAAAGNAQSTADSASTAASDAQSAAEAAQADLDSYKGTVSTTYATKTEVQQTASGITQSVSETYVTKTSASETYQPKGDYATGAELDATDAKADAAQTAASGAQSTANAAQSAATSAQSTATQALTKATEVEQTADGLATTVSQVQQTADGAVTTATEAKQTAEGFEARITNSEAENPNYILNGAPSGTDNALNGWTITSGVYQRTFPGGESHVDIGFNTARRPWSAGTVFQMSLEARLTSGSFSSGDHFVFGVNVGWETIEIDHLTTSWQHFSGLVKCSNAAGSVFFSSYVTSSGSKVVQMRNVQMVDVTASSAEATNYLKFDSSGLCIGNQTSGTLGYNALITSSQYQIRNGSTVLSSFGASQVQLGQNTSSASVTMCGGKGSIRYGSGSTSWGSTRDYLDIRGSSGANVLLSVTGSNDDQSGLQTAFVELDGPSQVAAIAGKNGTYIGTSKVNTGPIYLWSDNTKIGQGSSNGWRRIVHGVKVITASSTRPLLFTASEYTSIAGRGYSADYDAILVMNSNYAANTAAATGCFYNPTSGNIGVCLDYAPGTNMQITYVVFVGA